MKQHYNLPLFVIILIGFIHFWMIQRQETEWKSFSPSMQDSPELFEVNTPQDQTTIEFTSDLQNLSTQVPFSTNTSI